MFNLFTFAECIHVAFYFPSDRPFPGSDKERFHKQDNIREAQDKNNFIKVACKGQAEKRQIDIILEKLQDHVFS